MRRRFVMLVTLALVASTGVARTQQAASAPPPAQRLPGAALDDRLRAIFERDEFDAESFGPMRWLDGGRRYTSVRGEPATDIVAYDTATGQSEAIVTSKALTPLDQTAPLTVSGYAWSADRSRLPSRQ